MQRETISLPSAVSLVVTSMIGVGVFTSVGFQLLGLPSGFPILMLWVVGGIVSLCGALCFAELVAMMPRSGGEYHILREAYHPLAGFLAGWISVTAGFSAPIAAVGLAFAKYMQALGLAPFPPQLLAALLIAGIAVIHLGSLRFIGRFLTATTALKVALILAFLLGAVFAHRTPGPTLAPKPGDLALIASPDFATSLVYVMFAYLGWNGAAYVAGEIHNPRKNIPLAFCIGIALVTVLYILLNAVFLTYAPWDAMRGQVEAGVIAAKAVFGETGGRLMGGLIAFGIVSTVAGFTWAGSRVTQRIGEDYPRLGILARLNKHGAPVIALALQTALSLAMLFSGTFDQVLNYLMCQLILCSMLAVLAVVVMRIRAPHAERPFRTPLHPLPAILFLAVSCWMLLHQVRARPMETGWGLLTLIIGAILYQVVRRQAAMAAGPPENP